MTKEWITALRMGLNPDKSGKRISLTDISMTNTARMSMATIATVGKTGLMFSELFGTTLRSPLFYNNIIVFRSFVKKLMWKIKLFRSILTCKFKLANDGPMPDTNA